MTQPSTDLPPLDDTTEQPSALRDLTTGSAGTLLLLIMVFACYAWTTQGGYIWQDDANVTNNSTLQSFAGLSRIWTEIGATPQYFPLTYTSFWLENQLFGQNAVTSHMVNVALHGISVLLLWKLLRRLAVPGAWLAAAVFAVHPIGVETVAWITQRSSLLAMTLSLSATLLYLRAARIGVEDAAAPAGEGISVPLPDDPKRLYRLFLALFVLAVLAKTAVVGLPLMLGVLVWWQRGRLTKADLLPLVPAIAIAAVAGCVTTYVELSPYLVNAAGPEYSTSPVQKLMLLGQSTIFYAYKTLLPFPGGPDGQDSAIWRAIFPTSFNYERWTINPTNALQWLPLVLLIAGVVAVWALRSRIGRGPLAGVLIFLIGVLPVSGVVPMMTTRYAWVADHLAYFGSVGLIVLVVAALATLLARAEQAGAAIAAIVLLFLAGTTLWQSLPYRTAKQLWERTYKQNPHSWLAAMNYGLIVIDRANTDYAAVLQTDDEQKAVEKRDENRRAADVWLKLSLKFNPKCYESYVGLGLLAVQQGKLDNAMDDYRRADELATELHANFYKPAFLVGELLLATGKTDEGLKAFENLEQLADDEPKLLKRNAPLFAQVHTRHGDVLRQSVKSTLGPDSSAADLATVEEAMNHYNIATGMAPDFIQPKVRLASILIDIGHPTDALQQINDVFRNDKNNPDAKLLTAIIAEKQGTLDLAFAQLQNLLSLRADYLPAHLEMAKVLVTMGRFDDAITELTNTVHDFPRSETASQMLAAVKTRAATQPTTSPTSMSAK